MLDYLNTEGLNALWERVMAGIRSVRELAQKNDERIDAVKETADKALEKANGSLDGLDTLATLIGQNTSYASKAQSTANEALSEAQAANETADKHTERLNKAENTAGTALQTAQLAQNMANEALDSIETLTSEIAGLKTRIEALEAKANTNN